MKLFKPSMLVVLIMVGTGLAAADGSVPAPAGPAHLLKDINQTLSPDMGSYPERYQQIGGFTLFLARTPETGTELWRTDGTTAGTTLVKDVWPGATSGSEFRSSEGTAPFKPARLGDEALFIGNDGVHGWELWKSDGTEAGTMMVKEIRPGPQGAFEATNNDGRTVVVWTHFEANGTLYFVADDGLHGLELWRTDGSEAGTILLKDIYPGARTGFGPVWGWDLVSFSAALVGGSLFFSADDGVHGIELWRSDGTPAGTMLVQDINPGPSTSYPSNMIGYHGFLLFSASSNLYDFELWRSDGTNAGTYRVLDIIPGPFGSEPYQLTLVNDVVYFSVYQYLYRTLGTSDSTVPIHTFASGGLYFRGQYNGNLLLQADDGIHGSELWKSDGTPAGTVLLKDINPGPRYSGVGSITEVGGKLFFLADDGVHGSELWTSDGSEAGTRMIVDITPGPAGSGTSGCLALGPACVFYAYAGHSWGLWSSDGTDAGTRQLRDIPVSSLGEGPAGTILLGADDGVHGDELWKTDGTEAGTVLVKDINPLVRNYSSYPVLQTVVTTPRGERQLFFTANDDVHGQELWMSDGTSRGTRLVKDIAPGSSGSNPSSLLAFHGALYFSATDGSYTRGLWESDGTEAGTHLVAAIDPASHGSFCSDLVAFKGLIFFSAEEDVHGCELWKSDGTQSGTVLVKDIEPGPDSSYPYRLLAIGRTLYFAAFTQTSGYELWKSDGTESGTVLVKDIAPSPDDPDSDPADFIELGGKLFLTARDGIYGREPWLSDGTETGTVPLRDIVPGLSLNNNSPLTSANIGGTLYFVASDSIHGYELWKTDGTGSGTALVKDIQPGSQSAGITSMTALKGVLYFSAVSSGYLPDQLWRSDGTEAGTRAIRTDLGVITGGLHAVDSALLFSAYDDDHGRELWRSDGTTTGTVLVQDIWPGPSDSYPQGFRAFGDRVIFQANDGATGYEPWVAHTAILLNRPRRALHDLTGEVKALGLGRGLEWSLTVTLDVAEEALERGRRTGAIVMLELFSRYVDALSPRRIDDDTAADLRDFAAEIIGLLTGPGQSQPGAGRWLPPERPGEVGLSQALGK